MNISVPIKVKSSVRKYIAVRYGEEMVLTRRDHLGKMLINLLRAPHNHVRFSAEHKQDRYPEAISVLITHEDFFKRSARNLTPRTTYDFNHYVERLIMDEFHVYVDALVEHKLPITMDQMIDGFMGKYFFDDADLKPDTLKKSYQRFAQARRLNQVKRQEAPGKNIAETCGGAVLKKITETCGGAVLKKITGTCGGAVPAALAL